ncbi:hypothetical protein CHCC14809_3610 [Bacillus licheniformis]|nr:hypothetical protein CHCC14809_3610 [Bacillus licheniformis]
MKEIFVGMLSLKTKMMKIFHGMIDFPHGKIRLGLSEIYMKNE